MAERWRAGGAQRGSRSQPKVLRGCWANVLNSYAVLRANSGRLPQPLVDAWRAYHAQAVQDNTFFGASNYYTYLAHRPG